MRPMMKYPVLMFSLVYLGSACSDDSSPTKDSAVKDMAVLDRGSDKAATDGSKPDGLAKLDGAILEKGPGKDMGKADLGPLKDLAQADKGPPKDLAQADKGPSKDLAQADKGPSKDLAQADKGSKDTSSGTDGTAPTKGTILYLSGTSTSSISAYSIKTDGTGKALISGLPTDMDLNPIYDYGRPQEYASVTRHLANEMAHVDTYYQPLYLSSSLGYLYYFDSAAKAAYGFFQVLPDGTVKVLDSIPGTSYSTDSYYYYVGVKPDGTMFAAMYAYSDKTKSGLKLIRTDGKTFSGNSSALCDMPLASLNAYYPRYYSFGYSDKYFYFMATDTTTTSKYRLFRAPLDCSSSPVEITLPTVGGVAPTTVSYYGKMSENGKKYVLTAGSSSAEDVILVDDATGVATNLTDSPGSYYQPGYIFMYYYYSSSGPLIAVSPSGTQVAYVRYTSPNYNLFVRPADKSLSETQVNTSSNFASTVTNIVALQWANDDDLFFYAGPGTTSAYTFQMFHYKVSTGTVTQVTNASAATKPYSAANGALRPYGGWTSPNGKYLYFLEYDATTSSALLCNIKAIERATGKVLDITKGLYVYYSSTNLEAAETGGKVFFFAETDSSKNDENLYVFDQDTASTPVKLTSFTGTSYIYDIMPNKDGSLVAWSGAASTTTTARDLYVATTGSSPTVTKLTTTQGYVMDMKWFTSDNKHIVYGTGTSAYKPDLRIQPIAGGTATILDSTVAYMSAMMLAP